MAKSEAPLRQLLKPAFAHTYDPVNPADTFEPLLFPGARLVRMEKGRAFINSGLPVDRLYLLLSGKCYIVKYSADGQSIIADIVYPVQMLGLYELLGQLPYYRATVTTAADSLLLEFSAPTFYRLLQEDMDTALLLLEYLAEVMERSITLSDRNLFNSSLQNLVLYLRQQCFGSPMPCVITSSRKTISEEVNINLRTLYRHLNKLKQQGCLSVVQGKIVIDAQQYAKLETLAGEIFPQAPTR